MTMQDQEPHHPEYCPHSFSLWEDLSQEQQDAFIQRLGLQNKQENYKAL